ncbi:hypothetical protein D9619_006667 [Psilocybe cf. subviscida]|uniref:Uncharacterized protein n=1 Tax=Psilocybe cf. subviscida TaxID=2480587 RepID=A0A8H5EXM0_9AGAR|nr:hypothetical protein D9619_006667 [Psilocybe cf. subviscida]
MQYRKINALGIPNPLRDIARSSAALVATAVKHDLLIESGLLKAVLLQEVLVWEMQHAGEDG